MVRHVLKLLREASRILGDGGNWSTGSQANMTLSAISRLTCQVNYRLSNEHRFAKDGLLEALFVQLDEQTRTFFLIHVDKQRLGTTTENS